MKSEKSKQKYNKKLMFALLAMFLLLSIAFPLASSMGAATMNAFSLLEFYFIELMVSPPKKVWNKKGESTISDFLTYVQEEMKKLLFGRTTKFFTMVFWLLPLSMIIIMAPSTLIFLPFGVLGIVKSLLFAYVVTCGLSMAYGPKFYRYIRLSSLLNSVLFALITAMASSTIIANPLSGCVLFLVSLLPLSYFASSIVTSDLGKDASLFENLGYLLGSFTILFHIAEVIFNVLSVYSGVPMIINIAKHLSSELIHGPLLMTTTATSCGLVGGQLTESMQPTST